uniref:Putative secreted protein n=1 Tax=Ixodes ricinus TaxID=34613 RepID=A0A6B0U898_IXORI
MTRSALSCIWTSTTPSPVLLASVWISVSASWFKWPRIGGVWSLRLSSSNDRWCSSFHSNFTASFVRFVRGADSLAKSRTNRL